MIRTKTLKHIPIVLFGGLIIILPLLKYCVKYYDYSSVFYGICFVSITLLISVLFINSKGLSFSKIDILVSGYFVYSILSIVISKPNIEPLFYYKWGSLVLIYLFVRLNKSVDIMFWCIPIIVSGSIQGVIGIFQYYDLIGSFSRVFSVTGTFSNPGPYGGYLMVSLMSLLAITNKMTISNRRSLSLQIFTFLILITGLFISNSRAAILGMCVSLAFVCFQHINSLNIKTNYIKLKYIKAIILCCIPIVLFVLLQYKQGSVLSRILVWRVSIDMFLSNILFGIGSGNFAKTYMFFQESYFINNPESIFQLYSNNHHHPLNEFIHLIVEQGIIGASIIAILIHKCTKKQSQNILSVSALIALITFGLFSNISENYYLLIYLPILVGLCSNNDSCYHYKVKNENFAYAKTIIAIMSVGVLICGYWQMSQYNQYNRAITTYSLFNRQLKYEEFEDIFNIPNINFGLRLAKKIKDHDDAVLAVKYLNNISEYIPNSEIILDTGILYQSIGELDKAEYCFLKSSFMVPARILPNYRLFQLYIEKCDTGKALQVAEKIIKQKVSITSSLTLQIKKEAKEYIDCYSDRVN